MRGVISHYSLQQCATHPEITHELGVKRLFKDHNL